MQVEKINMRALMFGCLQALLLVLTTSTASAQSTWIVDSLQRPGFHFSDLPAAVAAASPGDRVFIRAAGVNPWEAYTAPSIQGKGLVIQGEVGPGLSPVMVVGPWSIVSIPAAQMLVVRDLELRGDDITQRRYSMSATNCLGGIVMEKVAFGWQNQSGAFPLVIVNTEWTDCALVVLRGCMIDRGDHMWRLLRSSMEMTGCTMWQSPIFAMSWGSVALWPTMTLDASRLTLSGSTVRGADAYRVNQGQTYRTGTEAIHLRNSSTIVMGANSILMGGTDTIGGRNRWTYDATFSAAPSTLWRDSSCQLIGDEWVQCCIHEFVQPQTGIVPTESPGQIQIQQFTQPSAPTILLLAPLQTTPWNFVIGPVFLDPTNLWSDLAVASPSGVLTRTLAIPPTIPPGQWVGAQAFSLDSTGRIMASNVTTVGVW